jgi:hypothetical protein
MIKRAGRKTGSFFLVCVDEPIRISRIAAMNPKDANERICSLDVGCSMLDIFQFLVHGRFPRSQIAHCHHEPAMVGRVAPRAPRLPTHVSFKRRTFPANPHVPSLDVPGPGSWEAATSKIGRTMDHKPGRGRTPINPIIQ